MATVFGFLWMGPRHGWGEIGIKEDEDECGRDQLDGGGDSVECCPDSAQCDMVGTGVIADLAHEKERRTEERGVDLKEVAVLRTLLELRPCMKGKCDDIE
jgi:hypothetical protein